MDSTGQRITNMAMLQEQPGTLEYSIPTSWALESSAIKVAVHKCPESASGIAFRIFHRCL